jgi:hypothetical protein
MLFFDASRHCENTAGGTAGGSSRTGCVLFSVRSRQCTGIAERQSLQQAVGVMAVPLVMVLVMVVGHDAETGSSYSSSMAEEEKSGDFSEPDNDNDCLEGVVDRSVVIAITV